MTMSIKVKAGNRGERGKIGLTHKILGKLDEEKLIYWKRRSWIELKD